MTRFLLSDIGRALYGEHWHAPMAADLGISSRTVRRWAAKRATPPQTYAALMPLIVARISYLDELSLQASKHIIWKGLAK
jgi:hypothetical protein